MKGKYLKYEFWKGDNCYFSKPSWWEIMKFRLGFIRDKGALVGSVYYPLIIFVPDEFEKKIKLIPKHLLPSS